MMFTKVLTNRHAIIGRSAGAIFARSLSTNLPPSTLPSSISLEPPPTIIEVTPSSSCKGDTQIRCTQDDPTHNAADQTHFGKRTVTHDEKKRLVGEVFSSVAEQYDVMNDLMSGTLHRQWKDSFVEELDPIAWPNLHTKIIDVAGGTGDISFRLAEKCRERLLGTSPYTSSTKITVCDINPDMLRVGQKRQPNFGPNVTLDWLEGDAETLDALPDDEFDLYTIAFGIRNVPKIDAALRTALRVLKPGGRLSVLEFSRVSAGPVVEYAYNTYSDAVIPALGQVIANDADSYRYLVESIRKFPPQREFERMIRDAGFEYVRHRNMSLGVVAMHSGFKPLKDSTLRDVAGRMNPEKEEDVKEVLHREDANVAYKSS